MTPAQSTLLIVLASAILFLQILILVRRRRSAGPSGSAVWTVGNMFGLVHSHYRTIFFFSIFGLILGGASFFPAEFGLARRVDAGRPSAQFYAPGPIVEAEITQPTHPIFYGYGSKLVPVRYANGPLLAIQGLEADRERQTLMRFRGTDAAVLSGLMRGAAETRNRPAIAEVRSGGGRIVLFATNPCFRYQTLGEFNMLFNAVLHHNDVKR